MPFPGRVCMNGTCNAAGRAEWASGSLCEGAAALMVVHDASGLQIGIDNGGADELHAAGAEVGGNGVGQGRGRAGNAAVVAQDIAAGKMPEIFGKAAPFCLNGKKYLCIVHGSGDFQPITDDPGILHQRCAFLRVIGGELLRVKAIEGAAEGLALVENALPGKARLKAFQ